jgi:CubicO group peptidase (beta-lactamase class C family)
MRHGLKGCKRIKARHILIPSIAVIALISVFIFIERQPISVKKLTIAEVPTVSTTSMKIDEYMKEYEKKGWFSGSILVARGGKTIISKGYGMANYELGVPNSSTTKFHLGSVTKQFTAMAVMQLEERGKLSVSDSLSKFIPDYPDGNKITIHQLLTHTSGIPDYINDDETFESIARLYHPIEEVIGRFKNKPLEFAPGTRYDYSNSGYVLLSYIIQKVSGKAYEDFLEENIFKQLNMKNTGYDDTKPIIRDRASGYMISSGMLINADFFDRSNLQGADGLYSTVEDLYTWDRALYTEKLVSKKTLERIFTPYPPADKYGYGWTINSNEISHYGLMDGFFTCIYRNKSNQTAVIILSNVQQSPIRTICRDINSILDGQEYKLPEGLTMVVSG